MGESIRRSRFVLHRGRQSAKTAKKAERRFSFFLASQALLAASAQVKPQTRITAGPNTPQANWSGDQPRVGLQVERKLASVLVTNNPNSLRPFLSAPKVSNWYGGRNRTPSGRPFKCTSTVPRTCPRSRIA